MGQASARRSRLIQGKVSFSSARQADARRRRLIQSKVSIGRALRLLWDAASFCKAWSSYPGQSKPLQGAVSFRVALGDVVQPRKGRRHKAWGFNPRSEPPSLIKSPEGAQAASLELRSCQHIPNRVLSAENITWADVTVRLQWPIGDMYGHNFRQPPLSHHIFDKEP